MLSMYLLVSMILFLGALIFMILGIYLYLIDLVFIFDYMLIEMLSLDISYEMMFDWISCFYSGAVMFISGSVMMYSEGYMKGDLNGNRFVYLMMMFIASMMLLVVSGGMVSIMLGWDGLGLVSYCLVIYYQSGKSYKAGMITILTNRVGDVLLLIVLGYLVICGSWNFNFCMNEILGNLLWLSFLIVLAASTKSAQVPFSAWLPEAMAAPTPVSSLVHSSTLVTAGIFLLVRFNYMFFENGWSNLLTSMSLLTLLLAGLGAMVEMDMKKVVASSTLSQLGLMMFMLSLGLWILAYFHMIMHAFFKALMFLCVGSLMHGEGGVQDFRFSGGKKFFSPIVGQGLLLSILCLMGFPFFCGFFSKDLMLEFYIMNGKGVVSMSLFTLSFFISGLYGLRLFMMSMMGMNSSLMSSSLYEDKFMDSGIMLMMFVSLVSGGCYMWSLDLDCELVMLYELMKVIPLIVVGMLIVVYSSMKISLKIKMTKVNSLKYFIGKLWYFSNFSSVWLNNMKFMGVVSNYDYEWMEVMGGKGISIGLSMANKLSENFILMSYFLGIVLILLMLVLGFILII